MLDNFDPMDKNSVAASLRLDNNDVIFSEYGEQSVTIVHYRPFQIKLTRLNGSDPKDKNRCIFSVELPMEYAAALGESSLRLVAPVGDRSQSSGVRLLLINLQGKVTDTLELRPPGNSSEVLNSTVFH